jgi:hypothetical protein
MINESGVNFKISDGKLVPPYTIIHGIGTQAYEQLIKFHPYESLEQFVKCHLTPRKKGDRSAVHSGIIKKLIVAGILDKFFSPSDSLEQKVETFERIKAAIKQEKVEPVPPEFHAITPRDRYMFRKKILSIYSEDIRQLFWPEIIREFGKNAQFHNGKLYVNSKETNILDWYELEVAKRYVDANVDTYAVGYVVSERPFMYKNKTKQATEIIIDVGGSFYKAVIWPKHDQNISPVGYKDQPVLLWYNVYKGALSLYKIYPLLTKTELAKYSVI